MNEIILPWPDPHLWPNNSTHRRGKAGYIRAARAAAKVLTLNALGDRRLTVDDAVSLSVTFYPPDARRRDIQNAFSALKGALDGVADALDCDDQLFHPVTLDWGHQRHEGCVVISLDLP